MSSPTTPQFSERWYRVSGLHPRLPVAVRVRRQVLRGAVWHLLSGGSQQASYRVNESGWAFVGRCDGTRSVADIWQAIVDAGVAANATEAGKLPSQDEIINLLVQMNQAELVEFERNSEQASVRERRSERKAKDRRARLNPMSFRLSLGRPDALLDPLAGWQRRLFSRTGLIVWGLLVLAGLQALIANWDAAMMHASLWLNTPRYLLIAWLCYPLMKVVHEAGHALALRRWGGEVREYGIGLFCLMPVPYVDATEAGLLTRRYQRCLVSAAGIAAELAMAAIAILAWATLEAGWLRDTAFSVALIGGVSTVFFNANPLMRLDGYYIACDALQLPNLAARSQAWWHAAIVRHVLGLKNRRATPVQPDERGWLIAYSPLSLIYRVFTSAWLVLWAGGMHPLLGVVAGAFVLITMFVMPLSAWLARLYRQVPTDARRLRARARLIASMMALLALVALVPLPDRLAAQGVVWLPEEAHLRADTAGFLAQIVADGTPVRQHQRVADLADIELDAQAQQLAAQRRGLETGLYQSLLEDPFKSQQIAVDLRALDSELAHLHTRRLGLTVNAGLDGRLAVARPQDQPGRYIKRGDDLGFIDSATTPRIRVAIEQEDAARLLASGGTAQVRLAQDLTRTYQGRIVRMEPAANERLPSAALSTSAAGDIVTDPADKDNLRALRPVRIVDLELVDATLGDAKMRGVTLRDIKPGVDAPGPLDHGNRMAPGGRAWVRFEFGRSSALAQLVRHAAQVVLVRFSPMES